MKLRDADERQRLPLPGREVTRDVMPFEIEDYLVATGYRGVPNPSRIPIYFIKGSGYAAMIVPSPRDTAYRLERVVEVIAAYEGRSPGSTLRAIAAHARGQGCAKTR